MRLPFSYQSCLEARKLSNGEGMKIEPRLKEWIKGETAKRKDWPLEQIKYESELGQA